VRACEDLDLWGRIAADFPVVTLRQPLMKYRLHGESIMAGAEQDATRHKDVKTTLERHIAQVAPGLDDNAREVIAAAWSDGRIAEWPAYFDAVKSLELCFSRGRRKPPGFSRVLADEHYTLWNRTGRPAAFLQTLATKQPSLISSMPWLRMAACALLSR
ncbi:MAG TPA: hypothetical protein VIM48_05255, partial [Chthoniobacterales bacterium]